MSDRLRDNPYTVLAKKIRQVGRYSPDGSNTYFKYIPWGVAEKLAEWHEAEVDKARREEHQDMMKRSWANDKLRIKFHEACIDTLNTQESEDTVSNNTGETEGDRDESN